eukprot:TRINITY_DN9868_c0_g2_i1.p1 TRINITY_DN9868_c0_g2~~TRINITY_DN9868_c0_g2_i1.p1  ORF type:complete len:117 (-),score=0.21 TRINITY_DN9868_c0_g2_i1:427-777(-)
MVADSTSPPLSFHNLCSSSFPPTTSCLPAVHLPSSEHAEAIPVGFGPELPVAGVRLAEIWAAFPLTPTVIFSTAKTSTLLALFMLRIPILNVVSSVSSPGKLPPSLSSSKRTPNVL